MFTHDAVRALSMSFFAGMTTLLGAFIVFIIKKKNEKFITISLGFSAGVMISVSFNNLLPHAQEYLIAYSGEHIGVILTVLFLIFGVSLTYGLDRLVPHDIIPAEGGKEHKNLFRVGFVSMLAITLHNFPEGIATFMSGYRDIELGISIAIAISMHNIPEGISVATPIYFATGSKRKAFRFTLISALSEPVGAVLTFLILRPFINNLMMGILFAFISGIMLYITIEELIPSSRQYGHTRVALISTFIGICLMPLANAI